MTEIYQNEDGALCQTADANATESDTSAEDAQTEDTTADA